jgi:hypothetical protein
MLLNKLHELQELQLIVYMVQFIATQYQFNYNNYFSTTVQLPHNVMLMSFFIHSSKFNMCHYEGFFVTF